MLYLVRNFLTCSCLLLFLFTVGGCNGEKEVKVEFDKHTFNRQVIGKLPLYDSLVAAIIANFPSFKKFIREEESYRSFRYMPGSEDPDVFIKLPPAAAPNIEPYYNRIGKEFIYGFDLFKDSSVKIYVNTRFVPGSKIDIIENLSWYPGGHFRDREFPEKDTILDKHWQYWIQFSKRGVF